MIKITFCGHKNCFDKSEKLNELLYDTLRGLLRESPEAVFYLGDYGQFDRICNGVLKELQKEYLCLRRVFVTPYLEPSYSHLRYAAEDYDEILFPFTDSVMPKYAITRRNEWMVDRADVVIAYVEHEWGGAAKTLEYAVKKKKRIVNLGDYND